MPEQQELLSNWGKLNEHVMHLTEAEVLELLEAEKSGKRRLRILLRLHNRFSKLRGSRERLELARLANV